MSKAATEVWSLSANDIVDDIVSLLSVCAYSKPLGINSTLPLQELIDSDTLLSEEDLLKPDPTSLRSEYLCIL